MARSPVAGMSREAKIQLVRSTFGPGRGPNAADPSTYKDAYLNRLASNAARGAAGRQEARGHARTPEHPVVQRLVPKKPDDWPKGKPWKPTNPVQRHAGTASRPGDVKAAVKRTPPSPKGYVRIAFHGRAKSKSAPGWFASSIQQDQLLEAIDELTERNTDGTHELDADALGELLLEFGIEDVDEITISPGHDPKDDE